MADSWANYLYKTHGAVPVSLLMSEHSLNLLNVLVKSRSKGWLQNIGSMVGLGTPESAETAALLRKKLQNFESKTVDDRDDEAPKFQSSGLLDESFSHTVKSRASVKSSLTIFHNGVDLDLGGEKHLECNLKEVRRVYEIWVIYEILYSRDIDVALVDSKSASGGASSSALMLMGVPPLAANAQASATRQTIILSKAPKDKMKPFGFKAIHAQYDAEGKFCKLEADAGRKPIKGVRGAQSDFIDPRTGLKGLFLKPPGDKQDGDEEDLLECLEIVVR
ncbi:unnamed protein product [Sphagnum balticum]